MEGKARAVRDRPPAAMWQDPHGPHRGTTARPWWSYLASGPEL